MLMVQLLKSMNISVKVSVMVRVYNIGAIFMASNIIATSHTKHLDIRFKYVNEYVENRVVKILFKYAENDSNIFTKNSKAQLHKKHSK